MSIVADEIRREPDETERVARAVDAMASVLDADAIVPVDRLMGIYVRAVVRVHDGNKNAAARALGVSRHSIYRWLSASR